MKRFLIGGLVALVLAGSFIAWRAWDRFFGAGTEFPEEYRYLLVPTGADLAQVTDSLNAIEAIPDGRTFRWLADRKRYSDRIRPGRYRIPRGISPAALVDLLRSGQQEPVRVTFNNIHDMRELAGRVSRYLEPDSIAFLAAFRDAELVRRSGATPETFIARFVPNTYELWWNTSPSKFIDRMVREHKTYWNETRRTKAMKADLSMDEVSTLASIVQEETARKDEAPRVAGVYLNRLRTGMPLQADPTLKFALGIDSAARVLDRDKLVDSPYNTYTHTGLPPGPIALPEPWAMDAVLDAEKHDYFYFCAREDFSGYSNFSRNYQQHLVNARRYQRALDQRRIYR